MPHVRRSEHPVFARLLPLLVVLASLLGGAGLGCEGDISGPSPRDQFAGAAGTAPGVGPGAGPGAAPSGPGAEAAREADAAMQAQNPTLFERARAYFPVEAALGGPARLFRLTRTQLDLTTRALLPQHMAPPTGETMPRDPLQTNYEYSANLSFNPANFTPYTKWVDQLATSVRANPTSVVDCTAMNNAQSCLEAQARAFTARAFRGVPSEAQLQRFGTFFASSVGEVGLPDAVADLVNVTLTSPHYVFRDEVRAGGGILSPAQQLQNISYTLADAPPQAIGLTADPATQVATPEAVASTIDRVLATPEARAKLLRFFISWLEVREPAEFQIATDVFPEFTPEIAQAIVDQTKAFLNHQLSGAAPKLKDVTQSTQSFVSSALAEIYDEQASRGNMLVNLDETKRLGIFTQPAVIASHSGPTTTRLVKRGVFFTRKVMCLPLGLPPPGVNTTLPEVENTTERKRVESATASATCQGCHAMINPFGFMQENYDAIGRWRTRDEGLPVDATIRVEFLDEGPLMTSTPVDALKGLTNSIRFQQCFARQIFRFYMGRDEVGGDDPVLRQMFFGFADKGEQNIIGMLQTLARSATFSQRSEKP
jgi:hypothetical protein